MKQESRIEKLLREREKLPRKQRRICEYIAHNATEAEMLTARQLAQKAGVGEATVFRFLKEYGYESYAVLKSEIHRYAVEFGRSSYWQVTAALQNENGQEEKNLLHQSLADCINLLGKTATPRLVENFDRAVEMMLAAPQVGILGLRSSKAAALYFYYLLLPLFPGVCQLSNEENYLFETVRNLPAGSVVFVVTSWPNTELTVKAAQYAHERGHKVILLANSLSCPIAAFADLLLITHEATGRYTVVPYIAVMEALARQVGLRLPGSISRLKEMDEVLASRQITNWRDKA